MDTLWFHITAFYFGRINKRIVTHKSQAQSQAIVVKRPKQYFLSLIITLMVTRKGNINGEESVPFMISCLREGSGVDTVLLSGAGGKGGVGVGVWEGLEKPQKLTSCVWHWKTWFFNWHLKFYTVLHRKVTLELHGKHSFNPLTHFFQSIITMDGPLISRPHFAPAWLLIL